MKKIFALGVVLNALLLLGICARQRPIVKAETGGGAAASSCTTKNGDTNADHVVDISDAVKILEYLFLGGTAPAPFCEAQEKHVPVAIDPGDLLDPGFDAAPAINQAILDANGGRVVLGAGIYRLRTPIRIDREGTILQGCSRGGRLADRNDGGTVLLASLPDMDMIEVTKRYVTITDLSIDGNELAKRGIRADISKGILQGVTITRTTFAGLHLRDSPSGRAFSWRVLTSAIFDNRGYGVLADQIAGNDTHIGYSVLSGNDGIALHVSGPSTTVTVISCDLENNCRSTTEETAHIFLGQGVENVRIQGCHFENDAAVPEESSSFVRARGPSSVLVIEGCYFNDATNRLAGIRIPDGGFARIVRVRECIFKGRRTLFDVVPGTDFVASDNDT